MGQWTHQRVREKITQISSREKGANGRIKIEVGPTVARSVWHVGRGCTGGASAPRVRLLNWFSHLEVDRG
jgi:hypothetical protein